MSASDIAPWFTAVGATSALTFGSVTLYRNRLDARRARLSEFLFGARTDRDLTVFRLETTDLQVSDVRAYVITHLLDEEVLGGLAKRRQHEPWHPEQMFVADLLAKGTSREAAKKLSAVIDGLQVLYVRLLWPDLLSRHHWVEWDVVKAFGIRSVPGELTYLVLFRDADNRLWMQWSSPSARRHRVGRLKRRRVASLERMVSEKITKNRHHVELNFVRAARYGWHDAVHQGRRVQPSRPEAVAATSEDDTAQANLSIPLIKAALPRRNFPPSVDLSRGQKWLLRRERRALRRLRKERDQVETEGST